MKLSFKGRLALLFLCCLFLAALGFSFIPYQTTIVPEWEIYVVDKDNIPLSNIEVRQCWQHFSLEDDGHEEYRVTNRDGIVVFPKRIIRANAIKRLIGPVRQFLTSLFEAGYGPHSWVIALNDGEKGMIRYWAGKPLEKKLVIKDSTRISKPAT